MEGSALANTRRRQASGADTALSNAVTSVTVSQQASEGQASEPAAGSTGEPQSPRAARSQVSTAVSFEGARAAGSAVQPERSVDEDSALSAAEPDGPVRSIRLQQGPRPANSLISTAVHPAIRNANNGSKLTLPPQHHPSQQHQPQALLQHQQQQAHQQQQQQLQQQQRYALPAVLNRTQYGRGPGPTTDHYASSPEVQRPYSITSQAVETRGDGQGHAGRSAAEQGAGPGRGLRTHPNRSNARGATPASVYAQIQAPGGAPGPPSPRKDRQHSLQWANAIGGGGGGSGGMDPATAAAAAAAAFLGNGLVGGWGLMQGLGQSGASITAAGHSQSAIPHSLLAAAAAGASGALPLQASPFNLAALGQLQLQAASHMQQQAAAAVAASAAAGAGLNGATGAGLLWQPSEQADSVPGALRPPGQSAALLAAAPAASPHTGPDQGDQFLAPPHQQQLLQLKMSPGVAAGGGGLASSSAQDTADGGRGGGGPGDRVGAALAGAGAHGQHVAISPPTDPGASRRRHRQARHSYGVPAAAYLGRMYGGAQSSVHPFALADMHGLQGLLMSASMSAAAAAAAAAGGTSGPVDEGAAVVIPPGSVRVKVEQQHTRGSSQMGPGAQHVRFLTANTNGLQAQQQQQQYHYVQQPAGDSHQQPESLLFSTRGYGHGSQVGEVTGTGTAANAAVAAASSEAGMQGLGLGDADPAAALQVMAVAEPVATTTATSACGGDHGTVVDGGAVAVVPQGAGTAGPHPAMQLYVPVILPLDLVSAQMAITQAAAAAAAVASAANQGACPCDGGGVGPASVGGVGSEKVLGGSVADGRGGAGSRDPSKAGGGAGAGATAVHSTQALNTSPQCFMDFEHESAQQAVPGASPGAHSDGGCDGGGGGRVQTGAAASVARGGGGGSVIPSSSGHGRLCALDGRGLTTGGGAVASIAASPLGNGVGPALSQHSAGSNPGAVDVGGGADSPEPGALGRASFAAPAASVETVMASVAAPGGPGGAVLPPFDLAGVDNPGSAGGGGGPGGMSVGAAVPAAQGAGFGGLALGAHANPHIHNNNIAINAHSNAYGAGPSMTQTADYRSHLQVALSLLLQATSAAYNSQRQSGVAGANEGSGIFVAAAQQASASNAVGQEVSDGMDGSGAGAGGRAAGVGSGSAGGAGIVSSGGGDGGGLDGSGSDAGRGGGGVTSAGNGVVGFRDDGCGANTLAAGVAARSMHGVVMGVAAAVTAEPMDTEGQVVDQATAASRGLHDSQGAAAAGNLRGMDVGTTAGLGDDGGGGGAVSGSPEAYQAPQWSTQRGGGGGGGAGGARLAMHGSSAGGGTGLHGHPAGHHGQVAHHHHHHHHHHSHHHPQGLLHSPAGYHHHRGSGAGGASGSGSGKLGGRAEGGCSPGVAQLEGALLLGCGEVVGTAAAGASVGSAGGVAVGDGEQADNNSALQMDEAGHPAASVHATVIAEESDASEGVGGDDSGSIEVPPAAAARGLDGGGATAVGGAATGTGGGIAAGVGSSKAAAVVGMGEIVSQRFDGARSRSREGQASKQPHDQLMEGPPTAGPGLGEVASHRAEIRSPARHDGGIPDPRDSSMGMAAGPSHDGTDSGSNGATTSDTVDMAEDSHMGSASEHGNSGMGADPRDLMQTDENLLPLDEHGGENLGTMGIGGGEDVEERGDDNDNAGSADGVDDGGAENIVAMDCDLDGDGDVGARTSVGPAAALLGMLGGGGGGASTGHIGPAGPNNGKGSPVDKAASHHPDRPDHFRHHLHHPGGHHHPHAQTVSKEATGGGGGVRASTSVTARNAHHHHHAGLAGAVLYGGSAVAALVGLEGDAVGGGNAMGLLAVAAGPAGRGAPAGDGAAGASVAVDGAVPTEALDDRGSPAPQAPQLQAANSTAMGSMRHGHGSPRRLGDEDSDGLRAMGARLHPYLHMLRDDRWLAPTATVAAITGVGPAFSASNAERQNAGMAATAAEALALHQQEERQRLAAAAAAAVEAETVAAMAAADAQASWQGEEDHQPSGSPGGPSLSAVMPQFTEVHGAFTRTAGTAAEAQASGMLLRGEAGGAGAGGAASGGNVGAEDPQIGDLGRQSTSQGGARLTAPRDAEVVGVSGTPATAGGVAGADGSASPQPGQAEGKCGAAALPFHRSSRQQQASAVGTSGGGVGQHHHNHHHQQTIIHRTAGGGGGSCAVAVAVAESSGGGDNGGVAAAGANGAPVLSTAVGADNYTKAESALHLTPASRAFSRGGGGDGMTTWTFRSCRVRGGHDGVVGPSVAAHADGGGGAGGTRDAAPGSVDGHGSNGIAPLEPYGDEDGIATAAVSQSGEVMLPPAVGGDFVTAAGDPVGGLAAAADVQDSSRRGNGFVQQQQQQLHGPAGPAMSGVSSRGGAFAGGCDAMGFGAVTPGTRRLPRYGPAVRGRGMPSWVEHRVVSPPPHHELHSQQQLLELQALPAAGVVIGGSGGDGGGHQLQHIQIADGPLSTQAAAYGGYDDEYDSDGERRRAEGPPQPQMTILVTSHAANSHHTVSGGTAVVSEADNGIAGAGPGGAGASPAVAAWEEEFDGPHRPPGGDAVQQQGSWRGGDCMGGMGCDGTKSAVMSSSRADPHPYPQHSTPQGHHTYHHHHHRRVNHISQNHTQQTPHAFPTRSAVFGEQDPDPSPTPQQQREQQPQEQQQQHLLQQQQQQPSTDRCSAGHHGPSRQRRGGGDAGAGETPSGAGGRAGEGKGNLTEVDDGEAAGSAGGSRGVGHGGNARGRRGARGWTRGEKRKRAHESSDRDEGRRSARTGAGSSGGGSGRGGTAALAGGGGGGAVAAGDVR